MAAEWHKVFNMRGFDKDATPTWQMVPVGGDRYMALRNGAGLTVTSNDPTVLTVTEIKQTHIPKLPERMPIQPNDRIFKLHGVKKGNARVQAKSGATIDVELEVDTKDRKTVRVSFNFVQDSAGHKTVRFAASSPHWVATMNYVYDEQANIHIKLCHNRTAKVAVDLGPQVMWDPTPTSEWNTVTALGDVSADMNYFLVWEYEQDATPAIDNTDAGTLAGNCIFEDNAGVHVGVTMAHELGHFLGRPDHYVVARRLELMYGITDQRGIHLTKADVNGMNP
jgi:hypothetical protein